MNLSVESLKNIETEIEKLETRVDVEFIPILAPQSSYTEHVGLILVVVFLAVFAAIVEYTVGSEKIIYDLVAILLAVILSRILCRFNIVKRWLISPGERKRQVHEKARAIFFNKQFGEVKSQNALLIYVSIMEHRIEIIPDPRMKLANLQEMTDHSISLLKSAFQHHEYEQGFIAVIRYTQDQLQDKFPRTNQGENLVSNKLIWWQD